jgi:hypothetical protein
MAPLGYRAAMGLTIHWELRSPATGAESQVVAQLTGLRARALELPFDAVSELVQLSEVDLSGPWPMRGLAFPRLEDVVDVAARSACRDIYCQQTGMADDDRWGVDVPASFPVNAIGFSVAPGPGSEPAAFGLATMRPVGTTGWSWNSFCKTQYASNHGEENFLRCHQSVVALLDTARELGVEVEVHDEGGYWESRDTGELLARVGHMNRLVAKIAGSFVDQARAAGVDSRQVRSEIFGNPDFERLESEE